jgi:hypothetical protein
VRCGCCWSRRALRGCFAVALVGPCGPYLAHLPGQRGGIAVVGDRPSRYLEHRKSPEFARGGAPDDDPLGAVLGDPRGGAVLVRVEQGGGHRAGSFAGSQSIFAQTVQPVNGSPSMPESAAYVRTMSRPCGRPSGWARWFQGPPLSSTSIQT